MSVSQAIKKIKYLLDMNQVELGRALGVTVCSINRYEAGNRAPGQRTLKRIRELIKENNLDMTIEEFLL